MNMKSRTIAVCLISISLFISSCGPASTPTPSTGTIEGTVFYSKTEPNPPITGAMVSLFSSDDLVVKTEPGRDRWNYSQSSLDQPPLVMYVNTQRFH